MNRWIIWTRMKILCGIVFFIFATSSAEDKLSNREIVGTVSSESGRPLADVLIELNQPNGNGRTGENGQFSLVIQEKANNDNCCIIRFLHGGFQPLTKIFDFTSAHRLDVTLKSGGKAWSPPKCTPDSKLPVRIGWDMKVIPPQNATTRRTFDADNIRIKIGFGAESDAEWMEFGTGALWAAGVPDKALLSSSRDIQEREMTWQGGRDYSGIHADGTKWRYIGLVSQTIVYNNASSAAAKYFDGIIDSMCIDPIRVIDGKPFRSTQIQD